MKGGDKRSTTQDTVKINVGGRQHEISLSLVNQNSESMLATLVSDAWRKDPTKPIFIDRDGDIFAHVLNYLRYGSIELPNSIPKSMFERELDYYGISCIQHSTSIGTMNLIKQRICDAELHHDMLLIAANCYTQFISGRTTLNVRTGDIDLKHNPYFHDQKTAMGILNCYLDKFYGLQASQQNKLFPSDSDLVLKVKEVASEVEVGYNQGDTAVFDGSNYVTSSLGGAVTKVTPRNLKDSRGRVLSQNDFIRALDRALLISIP